MFPDTLSAPFRVSLCGLVQSVSRMLEGAESDKKLNFLLIDGRGIAIPCCGFGANALEEITHEAIVYFGTGCGPTDNEVGKMNCFSNDNTI
eukprot:7385753-Karenia_brevis.AAC.1